MTARNDGRAPNALRPVRVTRRYLKHAMGSCIFELGDTRVLCAANIAEGVSSWRRGSGLGWVTAEYAMLPAATHTRGRRESAGGGPRGRTQEIQRLIGRSLRSIVDMGGLGGEVSVTIDCDVLQADGGTRTAAITGAYVALSMAMQNLLAEGKLTVEPVLHAVAGVSVGIVNGQPLLDLCYNEDVAAAVDMNLVMNSAGEFIEVQGTGEEATFSEKQLGDLLALGKAGIRELLAAQEKALLESRL
jgi:ribonuclease PH